MTGIPGLQSKVDRGGTHNYKSLPKYAFFELDIHLKIWESENCPNFMEKALFCMRQLICNGILCLVPVHITLTLYFFLDYSDL